MFEIPVTEEAMKTAAELYANREWKGLYSEDAVRVSKESWTQGNDLLLLLCGFVDGQPVVAESNSLVDCLTAVERRAWDALGKPAHTSLRAFLSLIEDGYVVGVDTSLASGLSREVLVLSKAISNPLRLQVLCVLAHERREMSFDDLLAHPDLQGSSPPALRRAVQYLSRYEIITERRASRAATKLYAVEPEVLFQYMATFEMLFLTRPKEVVYNEGANS